VSALAMSGFVAVTASTLRRLGVATPARIALTVLLAAHPMIVLYGGNGMSEALFMLFLAVAARGLLLYLGERRAGHLVVAGLALGLAYGARYEAAAAGGAASMLVGAATWWRHRHEPLRRFQLAQIDVALVAFPVVLSVALWALIGQIVSGDWFPTFTSPYGNSAQVEATRAAIESATGATTAERIWYASQQMLSLAPLLALLLLAGVVLAVNRRDARITVPVTIFGSVSAFHLFVFVQGESFGWLRFQIVVVPLAVLVCGVLLVAPSCPGRNIASEGVSSTRLWRAVSAVMVVLALAAGIPATLVALGNPALAREESNWVTESGRTKAAELVALNRTIAADIDAMGLPEGSVITDSANAYGILLATDRPKQYVISSDRDFAAILADLPSSDVRYLLVSTEGSADAVRTAYPQVAEGDSPPPGSRVWRDSSGRRLFMLVPASAVEASVYQQPLPDDVAVCGQELCLNGAPWRMYAASDYGHTMTPTERAALAAAVGINTIRLVQLLDENGSADTAPYDEATWVAIDERIAAAAQHGLKVLVDLSTYRNLLVNSDIDPYAADWGPFLEFLLNRRNTITGVLYKQDPTIAMFSLAGEVEPAPHQAAKGRRAADVTEYFRRTLEQAHAIDSNHLWTTGGLLHLDWDSGIDWRAIMSLPGNDVCAIHNYSVGDSRVTTPELAKHCRVIGKPWITEEFGFPQRLGDHERARRFQAVFDLQRRHGGAGVGFWNLGTEVEPQSHDVSDRTPAVWQVVRANAPARPG
jgi:hypothetical protein